MKNLLKNARENKGLGTLEVARLLKIDAALISKFESGQRNPTKDQIVKLADLLDIDLDTLTILWLKEKILHVLAGEMLAFDALKAAEKELNPNAQTPKDNAIDALFEEMESLKNKLEGLRNSK